MHSYVTYFPEYNIENIVDYLNRCRKKNKWKTRGSTIHSKCNIGEPSSLMKNQMGRIITFKAYDSNTKEHSRRNSYFFNDD